MNCRLAHNCIPGQWVELCRAEMANRFGSLPFQIWSAQCRIVGRTLFNTNLMPASHLRSASTRSLCKQVIFGRQRWLRCWRWLPIMLCLLLELGPSPRHPAEHGGRLVSGWEQKVFLLLAVISFQTLCHGSPRSSWFWGQRMEAVALLSEL